VLQVWESIVPPKYAQEPWISKLDGTADQVYRVNIDHAPFYIGDVCKPNECAGNDVVFLIAVDGSEAYGMLLSEDLNESATFGSPNVERQEVMIKKMAELLAGK
jgi:hypothetical protein